MGYRTLYIRDSEKLKLYLDNVVVETDKGELQFLISDLKFLIIDNYKTTLSTRLINELTKSNVSVVVCDMTHMPQNQIIPLNGYYASSGMMHKQISWDDNMKKLIHRLIVMAKVQSQIEILKRNGKSIQVIEKLISYKNEVMPGDVTNREGLSAKMYFRELFGPNFNRFDDDIINAGLNYGYAVFRSLITSTVVSKGLLPNFGLFHHNQSNFFNLSDDLIEVYRPLVDNWVFNNLINKELLEKNDREALIRLTDVKIRMNGQLFLINNTIEMYLESIIRCFDQNDISLFCSPELSEIHDL
ncbi:MAG: type II CRISPR-associated endonuclease Cas1 [Erysipelotrichaceae bacterium]|nr:type II CRISPR-associated endonuclease Cas1 [Erysipelotrichaceae bacterium]